MAFIVEVVSKVSLALEYLSEVTGVSSIFLICIISLVFLFFIFWFIILLKLRGIKKILLDVSRRMNAISIIARQQSSKNTQKISQRIGLSTQSQNSRNRFIDSTQKLNNAPETNAAIPDKDEPQRHNSKDRNDKLAGKSKETTNDFIKEDIPKSLSDWHLKSAILKLIDGADIPLSLQNIGKNLSGEYFDGNFNLILNEIEQLEKEGLIEGTSKGGKVLFKKKL